MSTHEIVPFGQPFFASKCVLGEAPFYRPEDNTLHYVDPLANPPELHILSLDNMQLRILTLTDSISVASFRKDQPGYIGARLFGFAFIDEQTGKIENLAQVLPESARGKLRFNDGASDSKGRFWAGTMDHQAMALPLGSPGVTPAGTLYRYDPDGSISQHETGIYCSNGLGWSADNKWMYFSDSYGGVVYKYAFDEEKGAISDRTVFLDFHSEIMSEKYRGGEPDGMVMDTEDNVWMALWGKACVLCFSPEGKLLREITANGVPYMTCTGWAGKNLDLLVCTSAHRNGLGGDDGGKLFLIDVGKQWGVKGVEKFKFAG